MANRHKYPLRRMPVGAEFLREQKGTHFRLWAPRRVSAAVLFEDDRRPFPLSSEHNGYFSGFVPDVRPGARYKYRLDDEDRCPDPVSRYQPAGPHGFSQVVDPDEFLWTDGNWLGVRLEGQVIYELHLGTFTAGGDWASAAERLAYLRDTGVTVLEIMPVADFLGRFGWGYDGVQLYAPASIYGAPDEMRSFVDHAHAVGLGVILDVVYNHTGPDGDYLPKFSPFYFNCERETDWGPTINFDGEQSEPVREFFRENAAYWIREFHLDGLRLDATQDIHDRSSRHILTEISEAARKAAGRKQILLIGENEPQQTRLIRPVEQGGYGLDALWNDDYHHASLVALTGKTESYYSDYRGTPQEFISLAKYGYLFQGQWYRWQQKRRGTSTLGLPRQSMINFIQNHDQIANSARGQRVHEVSSPGIFKALTALTLLAPGTPMLFQGQEFGASAPFLYFADHKPELAEKIRRGRIEFLRQWRSLNLPETKQYVDDPVLAETFERCRLNHSEVEKHREIYALHRDLLLLRRQDPVISRQGSNGIDGAVLSPACFVMRYFSVGYKRDRLLLVNLGKDLELNPAPEPLLGPPESTEWVKLWSSDDPQYGGSGTAPLDTEENWRIPGQAAVVLHPLPVENPIKK